MTTTEKTTLTGSCHCGFIKYRAAVELSDPPTATRCNCTICVRQGFTGMRLARGREDFELLSPLPSPPAPSSSSSPLPPLGSLLRDYQTANSGGKIHKYFCGTCGIHVCAEGEFEFQGKVVRFFSVNAVTFDQPQDGFDLSRLKIAYVDGRNDNWTAEPKEVPWPGGVV